MTVPDLPGAGLLGADLVVPTGDGRALRTMASGAGDDLVVLEAGLGASGLYWGPVHALIAERARVVAYERSGYGGSGFDGAPRDLDRLASDLDAVVSAHPHRRLVLVGHSWGGPIVRTLARRRIERGMPVAGVVLVDASDEHAGLFFSRRGRAARSAQAALTVPLARAGVLEPLTRASFAALDEPLRSAAAAASTSISAARSATRELEHVEPGLAGLRADEAEAGPIPARLSVISGMRAGPFERGVRRSMVEAHRATVRRHPGARFVPARRSGHLVPLAEPGLVAAEALAMLG